MTDDLRLLVRRIFRVAHRLAAELQPVGVVDQAIEDGVGHRWIGNDLVPLWHRELARDQRGALALPVIEYLQQLPVEFARDTRNPEIVHDEKRGPCQPLKQRGQAPVDLSGFQRSEELWRIIVDRSISITAGLVPQRAGDPCFARTRSGR